MHQLKKSLIVFHGLDWPRANNFSFQWLRLVFFMVIVFCIFMFLPLVWFVDWDCDKRQFDQPPVAFLGRVPRVSCIGPAVCRDQLGAQGFADESIGYRVSGCNFQVAIPSTNYHLHSFKPWGKEWRSLTELTDLLLTSTSRRSGHRCHQCLAAPSLMSESLFSSVILCISSSNPSL